MRSDIRGQLFRDLSKNLQTVGLAMFGFAGLILSKKESSVDTFDIYVMVFAIVGLSLVGSAWLLLVLAAKESDKGVN